MTKRIGRAWTGILLGIAGTASVVSGASADCLRRVYNRSGLVLVARQDGGPPATVLPGQALSLRLSRPGQINLSAYCGIPDAGGAPVLQRTFDYEAVIDRCFVRFGGDLFVPQIGRGFIGLQETAPFTVNNPRQGDIVLGPGAQPSCAVPAVVLNRRG
ncbi:hypothetical protein ACLBX9_31230 [Methylobacterium sp. A49B]|uniref:Uncharacterized protein n=1 Tax=Methylobacterium mesophilicum SR1.6/6 TaxID=908290 RepID=A0A6B9FED8_9HYPH|nr:hypothetical protein [Methylobacterium mesophilicum]QGY01461.1 hypothetical protein MMSR116_05765 [Methylobacterium mesophilicum SR1.6/6]